MTTPDFSRTELAKAQQENGHTSASPDLQRLLSQPVTFTQKERDVILQTCCGGASKAEADQLIAIAEARGMNPIKGECYFVKRWDSAKKQEVWAVQASIDAFRIKADETGLYDGQDEPEYEYGNDGDLPKLARVRVWRKGIPRPFVGVARYDEYVQRTKEGAATRFWKTMPHNQLAKCAEALAFRKAFPARFAKIYTAEEMGQAQNDAPHDSDTGEVTDPAATESKTLTAMHLARIAAQNTLDGLRQAGEAVKADSARMAKGDVAYLRAMAKEKKEAIVAAQKAVPESSPEREPGQEG